jgi:hypothetical protein
VKSTGPGSTLRPLGVGEVLDRAVNLCVKNFVPLTLIFLVYGVPLAIVQFYASKDSAALLQAIVAALQSGKGAASSDLTKQLNAPPGASSIFAVLLIFLALFIGPLPAAAMIAAAAAFYLGRSMTFGEAYRVALSRWGHLVVLNIMYGLAGGFLYLVVVVIALLLTLAVVFLYAISHVAAIVIGIIVGALSFLFVIAFFLVGALAFQVSYFGCVVEGQNLSVAFTRGIRRVFFGVGLQRALLVGLAYVAILLGIEFVGSVGAVVLIGFVHSNVAGVAYETVVRVITAAFTTAFIAIFYFDLRVREEGFDLQLAAQAARTGP